MAPFPLLISLMLTPVLKSTTPRLRKNLRNSRRVTQILFCFDPIDFMSVIIEQKYFSQ